MKKPAVHVSTLVHHKPSNCARVRLGGRDVWLGTWGTPEAEERYRRVVAEWLAHRRLPPSTGSPPHARLPVKQLILEYWRHAKSYYYKNGKPTSQLVMLKGVLRLLREHYGNTLLANFESPSSR
jgi:hypothetical protein